MSTLPTRRRRRRRRTHSSAVRRTPEQLRQRRRRRPLGRLELLACAAVAIICVALISLIWIDTARAVQEQTAEVRTRTETMVKAEATILAEQARRELQAIEQSLSILQSAWNTNPQKFDIVTWRNVLPVLTEVADDIFVANEKHIIVQDVVPQAVGQGIGSAYANFANGSLEPIVAIGPRGRRDNGMYVGELGAAGVERQYVMYLIRALDAPAGWVIGASYKSGALAHVFASASLGLRGVAALIDTHRGGVQAVVGTAAIRPQLNLNDTPMYKAMQDRPEGGVWIGRTAIDGVDRILAFHRVPGRDLMVLIGVARDDAMAPADTWAIAARSVAVGATLLVLGIGGIVLWVVWNLRSTRRRERALTEAEEQLARSQVDLETARGRAALGSAQAQALLSGTSDGVAVIDGELRLKAWNPRFAVAAGLATDALQAGLPLDEFLRLEARAGRYGELEDMEAEVARRYALLRSAPQIEIPQSGPEDVPYVLRAQAMPDGGLLLILRVPMEMEPPPPEEADAPTATEEV